jgi:hypothetical protein
LSVIVARSCYAARDALNGFLIKMFHSLEALPLCLYLLYYKFLKSPNSNSDKKVAPMMAEMKAASTRGKKFNQKIKPYVVL